jgi:hypothetical protein
LGIERETFRLVDQSINQLIYNVASKVMLLLIKLIKHRSMKKYCGVEIYLHNPCSPHQMEVSGELQAPAALALENSRQYPLYETGSAPEVVKKRNKSLASVGNQTPTVYLVASLYPGSDANSSRPQEVSGQSYDQRRVWFCRL